MNDSVCPLSVSVCVHDRRNIYYIAVLFLSLLSRYNLKLNELAYLTITLTLIESIDEC